MKRLFIFLLTVVLILPAAACGSKESALLGTWITGDYEEFTLGKSGSVVDADEGLCEILWLDGQVVSWEMTDGSTILFRDVYGNAAISAFELSGDTLIFGPIDNDYYEDAYFTCTRIK